MNTRLHIRSHHLLKKENRNITSILLFRMIVKAAVANLQGCYRLTVKPLPHDSQNRYHLTVKTAA